MKEKELIDIQRIHEAVNEFASTMFVKMIAKYYDGYKGWNESEQKEFIWAELQTNLKQEDYIDVANLAMMLHRFQQEEQNSNILP
jgi:hypothetical protein